MPGDEIATEVRAVLADESLQTATSVEALSELSASQTYKEIEIVWREPLPPWEGRRVEVKWTSTPGEGLLVTVAGRNEVESRSIRSVVLQILKPGVPWYSFAYGFNVPPTLFLTALVLAAGFGLAFSLLGLFLGAGFGPWLASVSFSVAGGVFSFGLFRLMRWLFPKFELYEKSSRSRRFGGWVLGIVVIPIAISLWLDR
jgi:hypothetical protein